MSESEIPVDFEVRPTPASHPHLFPHFRDGHSDDSIPVEISEAFGISGQIPFDFPVETRLENPVDFEVKFRSNFRSD